MLARVALVLVAVPVLVWVGMLLSGFERDKSLRLQALYGPIPPGQAKRERDLEGLRDASRFDPDSDWELAQAIYLHRTGRDRDASRVAEQLVEREPDNLAAWGTLFMSSRTGDPARAAEAASQLKRLDPLGRG